MTIAGKRLEIYDTTAGGMRNFSETMAGNQPGDPDRAARVILAAVDDPASPLRLPLGADAHRNILTKLASVASDLEAWSSRTTATNFGDESASK